MNTLRRLLAILAVQVLFAHTTAQALTCTDATIPPSNPDSVYTVNSDGTVSDTRNGLIWKQCAEGQSGTSCSGSETSHSWSAALSLAAASSFAGHSDWRLPNAKELLSLVEDCRVYPSINDTVFPATPSSFFWSGSPYAGHSAYAWVVNFLNGYVYFFLRYFDNGVRLVRGGQSLGSFDSLSAAPPVVNTPPTITNATFGSTGRQIGGSFNVDDAEGDSIKNISLILRGGNGFNCSTGYLQPYNQAVNTGLINIVSTDCVQNLPTSAVTWELALYDMRGAQAVSATGTLAREGNHTVPVGSRVIWTDSVSTFEIGASQTLLLSMVDAAGKLLSGFNGVGALAVSGFDAEMNGKRLVWFENGVASITGFTVLTSGSGTIAVTVPVIFAAADAASPKVAATSAIGEGGTLTASRQISASTSLCLGTTYGVKIVWKSGADVGDGELQVQKKGETDWVSYPRIGPYVTLRQTKIFQDEIYQLRFKPEGASVWIDAGSIHHIDRSCKTYAFITQSLQSTTVKRPIILMHGILGSTLNNDSITTLYPMMPKEICSTLRQCQGLSFWSIAFDILGWKGLQEKLEEMGYKVYLAPWDWRQGSLDTAAEGFLLPVIEQALKDSPGHKRVDVIAHSMGGLVTRALIQSLNKGKLIDRFIMVGTPNGGSVNAYYLMSAADPLRLDQSLGFSPKPKIYTNVANNLFLGAGKPALVKNDEADAVIQEGAGITGYAGFYIHRSLRRNAIRRLVPGGLNLLPLASNQFLWLENNKGGFSFPSVQDRTDLTTLYEKGSTGLACNTAPVDRRNNDSDPSVYTWLLLSNSAKTITKAHVTSDASAPQVMDDYNAMGKPGDDKKVYAEWTNNAGDGTVPFAWATSGLDALASGGCVKPFANGGSHAMMPANADIQTEIFRILQDQRIDLSLPSKASARAMADAPSVALGVMGPFRGLLEGAGGKFGDDGSSADVQTSLPGGSYQTLDNLTSFGVSPYSAGTYTVSLQPAVGFVGRWVPFELSSTVAGSSRSIKGGFIKSAGVDQIRFTVNGQGNLQLIDRPRMALNLAVSFLNNQQQTLISWDAPTDPGITGYRVYAREEERLNFSVIATLGRSENGYTYSGGAVSSASVTPAMEFVITALDAQGRESLASEIVSNSMLDGIEPISFVDQYTEQANTWVQSAPVSIAGNNVPVSITIAGGEYSIGGGAFTSVGGSVEAGQQVVVRVLTLADQGQSSTASLKLGDELFYFTVTLGSAPPLLGAALLSETIPAGTSIAAGQSFSKSWMIKNTGSTTWDSTAKLKWLSGANLSHHSAVSVVGSVATGDITTFSVAMTGPVAAGSYREDWQLLDGSGAIIPVSGSNTVSASIVVASNATAPGAPTLNSIDLGPGRATLHFVAPANTGGAPIASYTATCTASGQPTRTATGTGSPLAVRNLTGNVLYTCSLTATNGGGLTSSASLALPVTPTPGKKSNLTPILMLLLD